MTPERKFLIAVTLRDFRQASPVQKEAIFYQTFLHLCAAQDTIARFGMDYARRGLPVPFEDSDIIAPLDPSHFNEEAE